MVSNFWTVFCATAPFRFLVLTFLIYARLSSVSPLWPASVTSRAQHDYSEGDGLQGKRGDTTLRAYTRAELLSVQPARLTAGLVNTLRSMDIGVRLPRKRNKKRTNKNLNVAAFNAQSCRTNASEIYEIIVDNKIDILILTVTWLKPEGE